MILVRICFKIRRAALPINGRRINGSDSLRNVEFACFNKHIVECMMHHAIQAAVYPIQTEVETLYFGNCSPEYSRRCRMMFWYRVLERATIAFLQEYPSDKPFESLAGLE